jgi:hypothetical protein
MMLARISVWFAFLRRLFGGLLGSVAFLLGLLGRLLELVGLREVRGLELVGLLRLLAELGDLVVARAVLAVAGEPLLHDAVDLGLVLGLGERLRLAGPAPGPGRRDRLPPARTERELGEQGREAREDASDALAHWCCPPGGVVRPLEREAVSARRAPRAASR